jgi:hypothetical protein
MLKTHFVLKVNSASRDSGEINDFRIELAQEIKLRPNVRYSVRPEKITFPMSFYQTNSYYNTFNWIETDGATPLSLSVSLTEGSYTINELITELELQMELESASSGYTNLYTLTYNDINNKVNLLFDSSSGGGTSIDISAGSINKSIGFLGTETIAVTANADGDDGAQSRNVRGINIHSKNLPITNYYLQTGKQNVLANIPTLDDRWGYSFANNNLGYLVQLQNDNINEVQINLKDEHGNPVDMNGADFNFELVFYREKSQARKIVEGFASIFDKEKFKQMRMKVGKK